jgi:hypothetical protein
LKEKYERREDVEGEVRSYRMTLRKKENSGNWQKKRQTALARDLALEEVMDLS